MKKKEALSNSFASSRKKTKPLSAEDIEKLVEAKEAEKKKTDESINYQQSTTTTTIESTLNTPIPEVTPVKRVVTEPITPPKTKKATKSPRKRRKSEERLSEEREIKTSFDIPESLYDDMRIYLIRQKKSMRVYLLELIRKDLGKKKG